MINLLVVVRFFDIGVQRSQVPRVILQIFEHYIFIRVKHWIKIINMTNLGHIGKFILLSIELAIMFVCMYVVFGVLVCVHVCVCVCACVAHTCMYTYI